MLTPPSKGTPIDLEFIGMLTNKVNDIQRQIDSGSVSSSWVRDDSRSTFGAIAFSAKVLPFSPGTVDANSFKSGFTFNFDKPFLSTPVVVCTIRNTGSEAGYYISPVIKSINNSSVDGICVTTQGGSNISYEVHMIAIGIM